VVGDLGKTIRILREARGYSMSEMARRMRFALAALVALCAVVGIEAQLPCTFTIGGNYYDLTPLYQYQYGSGNHGDIMLADTSPINTFNYFIGFCSTIRNAGLPGKQSSFGQFTSRGGGPWSVASWAQTKPTATALTGGQLGLTISNHNGDTCGSATRVSAITLTCLVNGPVWPAGTQPLVDSTTNQCVYAFTAASSAACPTTPPSGTPGGISGGTIFLIILLVTTFLYIVLGCFYKTKYKGTTGRESCPNFTFWSTLPGLVKDGCVFTWQKLRGLCRRGGEEGYETVK